MNRRTVLTLTIGLAAVVGWYLFRPELLFINANVNEQFPSANASPGQTPFRKVSGRVASTRGRTIK